MYKKNKIFIEFIPKALWSHNENKMLIMPGCFFLDKVYFPKARLLVG